MSFYGASNETVFSLFSISSIVDSIEIRISALFALILIILSDGICVLTSIIV